MVLFFSLHTRGRALSLSQTSLSKVHTARLQYLSDSLESMRGTVVWHSQPLSLWVSFADEDDAGELLVGVRKMERGHCKHNSLSSQLGSLI